MAKSENGDVAVEVVASLFMPREGVRLKVLLAALSE